MDLAQDQRILRVAKGVATLTFISDTETGQKPPTWEELDKGDQDDAIIVADALIRIADSLFPQRSEE